eukprot:TRINITY_DN20099_c0_g1_i1.p1 TRINITY_DN20099_c0_g1~~TRINITY_DN20099_c0_g1_i1.p1  ORF type:complete len:502 (-),score=81.11 TRINITY_DN20099_c0_g1_i1:80-1585(-)
MAADQGSQSGEPIGFSCCDPHLESEAGRRACREHIAAAWGQRRREQLFAVVRHAERADVLGASVAGEPWALSDDGRTWPLDPPLSDAGVQAASELGTLLRDVSQDFGTSFHVVVTSPYFRCLQTAVNICHALGPSCRLLVDRSLSEVYAPDIFGDEKPNVPFLRSGAQTRAYCRSMHVAGPDGSKMLGKWPHWPEDDARAAERFTQRIIKYRQRCSIARRNFVLVTHGHGVASAFNLLNLRRRRDVLQVAHGGLFLAARKQAESPRSLLPASANGGYPAPQEAAAGSDGEEERRLRRRPKLRPRLPLAPRAREPENKTNNNISVATAGGTGEAASEALELLCAVGEWQVMSRGIAFDPISARTWRNSCPPAEIAEKIEEDLADDGCPTDSTLRFGASGSRSSSKSSEQAGATSPLEEPSIPQDLEAEEGFLASPSKHLTLAALSQVCLNPLRMPVLLGRLHDKDLPLASSRPVLNLSPHHAPVLNMENSPLRKRRSRYITA